LSRVLENWSYTFSRRYIKPEEDLNVEEFLSKLKYIKFSKHQNLDEMFRNNFYSAFVLYQKIIRRFMEIITRFPTKKMKGITIPNMEEILKKNMVGEVKKTEKELIMTGNTMKYWVQTIFVLAVLGYSARSMTSSNLKAILEKKIEPDLKYMADRIGK